MNGGNVQISRRKRMQDCGNEFFSHPEGTVLLEAEGASEGVMSSVTVADWTTGTLWSTWPMGVLNATG